MVEAWDGEREVHDARLHRAQHLQHRRHLRLANARDAQGQGAEGDRLDAGVHAGERVEEQELPDEIIALRVRREDVRVWNSIGE